MVDPPLITVVDFGQGQMSDKTNIAVGSKVITQKLNAEESNLIMKTFKQKALISALAGASAFAMAGVANAVYVNQDGLGQALIYPYYTVRAGNVTLLSVVNTTAQAKAVKVRFLEGKNSQEVLDFNLFLSAKDVWTGLVNATAGGAAIYTADKSCTNPAIPAAGAAFRNYLFVNDAAALQTLDRTREGYVEMIEMATIPNGSALGKDVTHNNGVPKCSLVNDASFTSAATLATLDVPSGGMFGNGTILNAAGGASTGYDAVALDGLGYVRPNPTSSQATTPNFTSGGSLVAVVNSASNLYVTRFGRAIDAVSATMMHDNVYGEYAFTKDGIIGTDWVVTMPTKREYVNSVAATPPFQRAWSTTEGISCDDVSLTSTDREEFVGTTNDDFSPRPPGAKGNALCYEANVISFGGVSGAGASLTLGSTNVVGITTIQNQGADVLTAGKEGGWLQLTFQNVNALLVGSGEVITTAGAAASTSGTVSQTYYGLPVVGFAISGASFKTGNPQQNYSNSYSLKASRKIVYGTVTPG
ncbi:MAG: hypothetical protein ABIZ64_07280 [Casimicrobium sp.]|jgi:hypothetical protein